MIFASIKSANIRLVGVNLNAIMELRPTVLNTCTEVFAFFGANCGPKGVAILHNWCLRAFNTVGRRLWLPLFCYKNI